MQKLTPGYIFTKFILFIVLNAVGICLSIMFLQIAKDTALSGAHARAIAGGIGLAVWCILQWRTMMGAKLDKISRRSYLFGEAIGTLLFLIITAVVCTIIGHENLTVGFQSAVFLPMMPFCYLLENLYIGLILQLVFYHTFTALCYTIKRKKDPSLLGRAKGGNIQ